MQRLLEDAEKLSGVKYDISSYSDMIEAIHVVQTEMGITGTTAAEASSTIQGSVSAAKSAWENLVAGLGNENADLDQLVGNLVTSTETAAGNIIPRVTQILSGMGTAITQIAPVIAAEVPTLITSVLPSLVSGGAQLLTGLITGIISALPSLVSAVPEIVSSIVSAVSDNLPAIQAAGVELLNMLTTGILDGIPVMVDKLPDVIDGVLNFISENLPTVMEKGGELLEKFAFGIIEAIPQLVSKLPQIISSFTQFITENGPKILQSGGELLGKLIAGILGAIPEIAVQLPEVISAIVDAFKAGWDLIKDAGKYLLEGLWAGISDKVEWLKGKVTGVVDTIKGWFTGKDGFDEHSPSKWAQKVGEFVSQGLAQGIKNKAGEAEKAAEEMAQNIYESLSEWAEKEVRNEELALREQLEMWRAIQAQFLEGSQQYAAAEEKIFEIRKGILQENLDLEQNYQDTLADRTKEILSSYKLFDAIPEYQKVAGQELIDNLKGQISSIEGFYNSLTELSERGVGEGLISEIRDMGVSASGELTALLALSDDKLSEYAQLYEEKQALANSIAVDELSALRDETNSQIRENLNSLEQIYTEESPEVGHAFTGGLAEGIRSGMSEVVNSAISVARAATDAVKDVLGIHSPSTVFAAIGENMALGLAKGWDSKYGDISNRIKSGLDFGAANVDFASSGLGVSSAAIANSVIDSAQSSGVGPITLNLTLPNGDKLASYIFDPLTYYAKANGTPILDPT